jgi:hypothetical protein
MLFQLRRSIQSLFVTFLCAALFFTSFLAYTPSASALVMNNAGDYVKGGPAYPIWQVVDSDPAGLNCRTIDPTGPVFLDRNDIDIPPQPDISKWAILKTFKPGEKLIGSSGNRVLAPIQIDDNRGKSWIVLRLDGKQGDCLVRANSQFVRPLLPPEFDGWRCQCRAKDCGSRQHPNSTTLDQSQRLDPSSPDYSCGPTLSELPSVPNLEQLYQPILKDLQMTGIPLRLPTYVPAYRPLPKGTPPTAPTGSERSLRAISRRNTSDHYFVMLAYSDDCSGASVCRFGVLGAERLTKETRSIDEQYASVLNGQGGKRSPEPAAAVVLSKGIKGRFIPWVCGANCTDAFVIWEEGGYRYTVGRKVGDRNALVTMASSAIESSIGR